MDENLTPATSPVPQSIIAPTPAPGLRGPSGLSPRQNYSRVNTGSLEGSDAGGLGQKSIMPKVGSVMSQISMATRPRALNDMLKTAMESTLSRVKIAEEAKRQLAHMEGKEEEDKKEKKEKDSCMKTASTSDSLPTDYVLKLAEASDYIVELLKEGADLGGPYELKESIQGAGIGPGVLEVTHSMPENPPHVIAGGTGQAKTNKPPTDGVMQKAMPQEHGATQMANDDDRAPGTGDPPVSGSTKNAAPMDLLRKMSFAVSEKGHKFDAEKAELLKRQALERAEHAMVYDALGHINAEGKNPATFLNALRFQYGEHPIYKARLQEYIAQKHREGSNAWNPLGGALTPLKEEVGGTPGLLGHFGMLAKNEKGKEASAPVNMLRTMWKQAEDAINPAQISAGPAVPPDTTVAGEPGPAAEGKDRVPSSAQGVADMNRREAKSVPKQEMGKLLDEPMMSAAHDNVLQQAFAHTNESGAKLSSADQHQMKLAAAKALLQGLAKGGE